MPVHDWTHVLPGVFHHFHQRWIASIADAMNDGRLPEQYYALAEHPPAVRHTLEAELEAYSQKSNRVAVYHASGDRVVAYVEIVSPGNKHCEREVVRFLDKLADAIRQGCHLLVIDLHPPSPRDPHGLHARFWQDYFGQTDSPGVSAERPMGLAAYRAAIVPTAFFQTLAVGEPLIDMPVFLTPDFYVNAPLEATYLTAWESVPGRWRRVIEGQGRG